MANLAFKIANDLLNAGVITEDTTAIEVQELVQARLNREGIDRAAITHFQDATYDVPYGLCHQKGVTKTTDNSQLVTCLKCLDKLTKEPVEA